MVEDTMEHSLHGYVTCKVDHRKDPLVVCFALCSRFCLLD
jgi:hypothetical protein